MHILKLIRQELYGVLLGIDPTYVCWKIPSPPQPPLFPLQKTDIVTCGWTMKFLQCVENLRLFLAE